MAHASRGFTALFSVRFRSPHAVCRLRGDQYAAESLGTPRWSGLTMTSADGARRVPATYTVLGAGLPTPPTGRPKVSRHDG